MIEGIAASSSIAVPSGRFSHAGESSVRKSAMPKLTGIAMTIAMSDVTKVPVIGTSAPNFSFTGSQSLSQMKPRPQRSSVSWLPYTSEIRIAASRLNTSRAKSRVTFSNATSIQREGRRRIAGVTT